MANLLTKKTGREAYLVALTHSSVASTTSTQLSAQISSSSSILLPELRDWKFQRRAFGRAFD